MGAKKVRQVAADPDFANLPREMQDQLLVEAEAARDELSANYEEAVKLHTDEQGRTLSFPHMAVPAADDPFAQGVSITAATLPLAISRIPALAGLTRFIPPAATAVDVAPHLLRGDVSGAAKEAVTGALVDKVIPGPAGAPAKAALIRALTRLGINW